MTILSPLAFFLSLVAVPVLLLYVLRLRRPDMVVSSTLLWRRVTGDLQANAPWQRLRPTLLLLLQLLAVLALVLALAHPAFSQTRTFSGDLIVIVDQSFGMQARDVAPSRFDAALAKAHSLAGELAPGNRMSVIGMGAQPRLAVAESDDQQAINSAIDGLAGGTSAPNVVAALSLANSLARNGVKTRVVLLTSRDSGITGPPGRLPFQLEIIRLGGRANDLGLTAFQASITGGRTQAIARVHNFGPRPARSDLDLTVDGQLADVRPIVVPPGQDEDLVWSYLPGTAHVLQAHLSLADDMSLDKTATVELASLHPRRVVLVTTGDGFLQTALRLDPTVSLTVLPPQAYGPRSLSGADLAIFDGMLPPSLPQISTWIMAPPSGRVDPLRFGRLRAIASMTAAPSGPLTNLLRYVDLSNVHLSTARVSRLPSSLRPLAVGPRAVLIAAGEVAGRRMVVMPFDPLTSDWPLRLSYPIAIHNLLSYLAPTPISGGTTFPPRLGFVNRPAVQFFGHSNAGGSRGESQSVDLGWIVGLGALAFLSVEWWVSWRR